MSLEWLDSKRRKRILVIGDLMLDQYWYGQVSRISPEAPVPVSQVEKIRSCPGGAANVAVNLTGLDDQVMLMGFVGEDEAGNTLIKALDKYHVDHQLIKIEGRHTIRKLRLAAHNQQLIRADYDSDFTDVSGQLLDAATFRIKQYLGGETDRSNR